LGERWRFLVGTEKRWVQARKRGGEKDWTVDQESEKVWGPAAARKAVVSCSALSFSDEVVADIIVVEDSRVKKVGKWIER